MVHETEQIKLRIADIEKLLMDQNSKLDLLARGTMGSTLSAQLPDSVRFPLCFVSDVEELELQMEDKQVCEAIVSHHLFES